METCNKPPYSLLSGSGDKPILFHSGKRNGGGEGRALIKNKSLPFPDRGYLKSPVINPDETIDNFPLADHRGRKRTFRNTGNGKLRRASLSGMRRQRLDTLNRADPLRWRSAGVRMDYQNPGGSLKVASPAAIRSG
jgi:hypothetical protein